MGEDAIHVTKDNFECEIIRSEKPAVVDFWAKWCGPCRMVAPVIEQIAKEYKDKAVVAKLDIDSSPEMASRFSVMNIPTIIFFKQGKEADRIVGVSSRDEIAAKIDRLL